jgi:hypothetical protein
MLPSSVVLLDTLEHAEINWFETGNWSKMGWAADAIAASGEGATITSESATGTIFGSYWSHQEFNHRQFVEFQQESTIHEPFRIGPLGKNKGQEEITVGAFALWLCYNNSTHSGYRFYFNKEATVEEADPTWQVMIRKVTSGSESTLAEVKTVALHSGEKYAGQLEGKVLTIWRKKPSEFVFNEITEKGEEIPFPWEELLKVTDSGSAFTSGFVGFDIERRTQRGKAVAPHFTTFSNSSFEEYVRSGADASVSTDVSTRIITRGRTTADSAVETDVGKKESHVSKTTRGDASALEDFSTFSMKGHQFLLEFARTTDSASKLVALPRTTADSAVVVDTLVSSFSAPPMRVENTWAAGEGKQSLRSVFHLEPGRRFGVETATGTGGMGVKAQKTYTLSADFNVNQIEPEMTLGVAIAWFTETGTFMSLAEGNQITSSGLHTSTVSAEAPIGAAFACAQLAVTNHASIKQTIDFYSDDIIFTASPTPVPYFDGDTIGVKWEGQFGQSGSVQVEDGGPGENTVVIDSVLLDPLTPNIAFSVYYSTEGTAEEETTETEWERKLWTRVPKTFIANQRQTYVFPEPITAKFVKIEYSFLQAQSYNPGQNQLPTTYKKFPKWVADFFIAQMEEPQFIANTVGVKYDALDFAYNYFLDDLGQFPASPVPAPSSETSTLTQFFNTELETNKVDPETLAKINLVMQTYTQPPGAQASSSTLLGSKVRQIALSTVNYPVEKEAVTPAENLSAVSTLRRDNIVFEQGLPIMYFFLTCRHYYKELTAIFEHNRAYFAGVKEIAFIRDNYTTTYDGELYIETGGDDTNTERNDFVVEPETGWFTY